MWRYSTLAAALLTAAPAQDGRFVGRWDITIQGEGRTLPSWLEVDRSGNEALVGRFVAVVGSARPVSRVEVSGDTLRFAIPPQWEGGSGDLSVAGHLAGDSAHMAGTITFPDGKQYPWTAVRAPELRRTGTPAWGSPVRLFDGKSLAGWRTEGGAANQWEAANGVLRSPRSGANLVTERAFGDFRLHIEFRFPKGSNSGIYLRGRHEVQVEDDETLASASHRFSGVYGFIAPSENVSRGPGQWQSYDITLVGRMITVVANGKRVICDQEIPGITGGALDSNEGEPGPLLLQGDHGPIEYRNIVLTPAR